MLIRLSPTALDVVVMLASSSESNQRVPKQQRSGGSCFPADCRLIAGFSPLVMKPDLMATIRSIPQQISGAAFATIEQPSPFAGGVAIGRLPNFAQPKAVASLLPSQYRFVGPGEIIRLPSIAKGWMFKNAATSIEGH